jgi:hypothetical protein
MSDFFEEPGPEFDPDAGPTDPTFSEDEDPLVEEGWKESTIKELLATQGELVHFLLRVGDDELDPDSWKHTQEDLRRIAPPLTRMLNRYDVTKAAAVAGDEASLAAALAAYGGKNYIQRRRLLAQLAAHQQPRPVTGVAADPDVAATAAQEMAADEVRRGGAAPPALRPKGIR